MRDRAYNETMERYNAVSSSDLVITGVRVSSSRSYTTASGTLTNYGKSKVKFVEVRGAFQTSSGTTVDTDWTYAVGSEGLSPGESTKFEISVDKDSSIKKCSVSVIDFDS